MSGLYIGVHKGKGPLKEIEGRKGQVGRM